MAVFPEGFGNESDLPSRLKTWIRVRPSTYAHPIVERTLYATRYALTAAGAREHKCDSQSRCTKIDGSVYDDTYSFAGLQTRLGRNS